MPPPSNLESETAEQKTSPRSPLAKLILLLLIFGAAISYFVSTKNTSQTASLLNATKTHNGKEEQLQPFSIQSNGQIQKKAINREFKNQETIPFAPPALRALSLSGSATLENPESYARVILTRQDGTELLVANFSYPDEGAVSCKNLCEETCALDATVPKSLTVELKDATINLSGLTFLPESGSLNGNFKDLQKTLKQAQVQQRVSVINAKNKEKKELWVAGETDISKLPYVEKKKLFGGALAASLDNFLYYTGGYFPISGSGGALASIQTEKPVSLKQPAENKNFNDPFAIQDSVKKIAQSLVKIVKADTTPFVFDWRARHGQNWITPAKNQSGCWVGDHLEYTWNYTSCTNAGYEWRACGSCVAMATNGAVEALANLYFNKQLNLDLSEQDLLACGADNCAGGQVNEALNYIQNTGVVDEACYPYRAQNSSCSNICADRAQRQWKTSGSESLDTQQRTLNLKRAIAEKGPVAASFASWNHVMAFIGFGEITAGCYSQSLSGSCDIRIPEGDPLIGTTYWIVKNSYGTDWGEQGFAKLIISEDVFNNEHKISLSVPNYPVIPSLNNPQTVFCTDADHDGYSWWGLGQERPSTCPTFGIPHPEKDCDDSNPAIGACGANYICGNHPFLASGEVNSFGDYPQYPTYGQYSCCGDNLSEYPISSTAVPGQISQALCCNQPNDILAMRDFYSFLSKYGTQGSGDGQFNYPNGIAHNGNKIVVADTSNNRIQIFQLNADNSVTWLTTYGSYGTGDGQFYMPEGVTFINNKIYVADTRNNRIQVLRLNEDGSISWLGKFGSSGTGDGQFQGPTRLAVSENRIYITDSYNSRIQILKEDANGTMHFLLKYGGYGLEDGQFLFPYGIAVSGNKVFVADAVNNRIQELELHNDNSVTFYAKFGTQGSGDGQFNGPSCVHTIGNKLLVCDTINSRIEILLFSKDPIIQYATTFDGHGSGDGAFLRPRDLSVDDNHAIIIDRNIIRFQVFKKSTVLACTPR